MGPEKQQQCMITGINKIKLWYFVIKLIHFCMFFKYVFNKNKYFKVLKLLCKYYFYKLSSVVFDN